MMEKEDLQKKLEEAEKKKEEYLNGWKRARADLANYKKKERERMERFLKVSLAEWILKVLPILDSFDRAEESLSSEEEKEGLARIKKQFQDLLRGEGVEEIDVLGKKFDPGLAEAVDEVESEEKPGTVVEVVSKGYRFGDRVLRPAKVVVSKED